MTKRITLAVTGSISAYKAADLTSQLIKKGYHVTVLMTQAAQAFITPLTLQVLSKNTVHLDVMAEDDVQKVNHIDIAKKTDRSKIIDQAEEHEFFNQVKYTVQTGALKDASLRVRYSYLRSSDTYNNVSGQYVSNVIGSTNEWRLFLDIPVKLF